MLQRCHVSLAQILVVLRNVYPESVLLFFANFVIWHVDIHVCIGVGDPDAYMSMPYQNLFVRHAVFPRSTESVLFTLLV